MLNPWRSIALVLLAAAAAPCFADIYAFVDDSGRSHFSDVRMDDRYKLYMKTPGEGAAAISPELVQEPPAVVARSQLLGPVTLKARKRYSDMIRKVAKEQKIDAALLHAVVTVESAYNERAKSPKGATGLMQVMPETGKRFGVTDLLNPVQNLRAGARYLRALLALFSGDMELAIAAYNAGEGAVMRSGNAIPNYPETKAYVPRVLEIYERYRAL
jgi:soluble lytic murein transglycosylase-like protein